MPPAITDLRERTTFLEKTTRYVFSLDLWLAFDCPASGPAWDGRLRARGATREQIRAARAKDARDASQKSPVAGRRPDAGASADADMADSYHVIDEELTTTVDGGVHELPLVQVNDLQDWITVEPGGLLNLAGRCRLRSEDDAFISMSYAGVVHLGFAGERSLCASDGEPTGRVQVAAQFESDRPRYRWLTQAQFIGFGEATVTIVARPPAPEPLTKTLALSIDFYSAI